MARLPQPGGDSGNWGTILNDYLSQSHKNDGTIKDNVVTANNLAPNSVTNAALASDSVNAASIADGVITKTLLDSTVQSSLTKADTALQSIDTNAINNTVLSNASQLFTRVLIPQKYGAIGDGIANDTTALQAMLDDAGTGDLCELGKAGVIYNISATLIPRSDTTIHGSGAAIRAATAIANDHHIRINTTVSNVTIDGIVFPAALVALTGTGTVIRCSGPLNKILNNRITAATRWGIQVSSASARDNKIDGNQLDGSGINYSADSASRTICSNNIVKNSPNNGLSGTGNHATLFNEDCIVVSNTVIAAGRMGIEDWQRCRRTIIRDNYVESAHDYAISAVGESTLIVGNKLITPIGSYGIEGNAGGTKIDSNHITYSGTETNATGIMINSVGTSTSVFGCTISNNYIGNAVIGIDSTGTGLRGGNITGNIIENWRTTGVTMAGANIVSNRFIQRNPRAQTRSGILVSGNGSVTANSFTYESTASAATGSEIAIRPTSAAAGALIVGNNIDAAYTTLGISSSGSTANNVTIISNSVTGSATYALAALVSPVFMFNSGTISQGNTDMRTGFFTASPVARAAALVQTYSTADRTLGAYTANAQTTAFTGSPVDAASTAKLADINALRIAYENLRLFVEDLAQHHNAVVDDLQAYGLEQ